MTRPFVVVGATGHTGRFVVAELARRGLPLRLVGRTEAALTELAARLSGSGGAEVRVSDLTTPSIDHALEGAAAVLHCAGPFLDTAAPVIEAALRARVHYLDVTAEQGAALSTFERYAEPARTAGISIIPAMSFYGGLADLLATAALADWPGSDELNDELSADEIDVAVALDSWHPTEGTRLTGQRNTLRRQIVVDHQLAPLPDPAPRLSWSFAAPFGTQDVVMLPLTEVITIHQHIRTAQLRSYMNLTPLAELRDPSTPAPVAVDAIGRSAQQFLVEVRVRRGDSSRLARASGQDIYAITAPILVEAATRLATGRTRDASPGVAAPGERFDARDFLAALPLTVEYA